jgi:signal transduction histidine kinase
VSAKSFIRFVAGTVPADTSREPERELERAKENAGRLPGLRSPLAKLLHALNQPLTGLQCSMEVALASPRTGEQYEHGLRQGLELTGRMRALVEAIREVADVDEENREAKNGKEKTGKEKNPSPPETIELKNILRGIVEDLGPVAEAKKVRLEFHCGVWSSLPTTIRAGRQEMTAAAFRLLESAITLADCQSALRIEAKGTAENGWIRLRWHGRAAPEFCPPELGLLVAQAGWERAGARWRRERRENLETITIELPPCIPE